MPNSIPIINIQVSPALFFNHFLAIFRLKKKGWCGDLGIG
jgi:hypothetical protein